MKKKTIIISIATVILVAGSVVLGLWLVRNDTNSPTQNITAFEPDRSVDYGACKLLNKQQIKDTFGDVAKDLQDGFDSGRIFYSDGIESQYCSYNFSNDSNNGNFNAEIIMKNTEATIKEVQGLLSTDEKVTEVQLSDAVGYYKENVDQSMIDAPAIKHFTLVFFNGTTQYALSINLPENMSKVGET